LIKLLAAAITLHDLCNRTTLFKKEQPPWGTGKKTESRTPRTRKMKLLKNKNVWSTSSKLLYRNLVGPAQKF